MVEVELNLMLVEIVGQKHLKLEIGDQMPLDEFIAFVGLHEGDVGMMLVNKEWAPVVGEGNVIRDGDYVQLYPMLEGG
jgi:hypothetical protein